MMDVFAAYRGAEEITEFAKLAFREERAIARLDGWFLVKETEYKNAGRFLEDPAEVRKAKLLLEVLRELPLSLGEHAVFAGTQRDAFARTYALINPAFQVESFAGYCDPTAIFGDIVPNEEFTAERIARVHEYVKSTPYVRELTAVYDAAENETAEVAYFIEQVTGHIIPDFKPALACGAKEIMERLAEKEAAERDAERRANFAAMRLALSGAVLLAHRYADIARAQQENASPERKAQLAVLEAVLRRVPEYGARTLYEAIQSYLLLWQVMCLEQAPNPFALSVGNADRIFEHYRLRENLTREQAAALFKHFLVFFNVGDRSWAISQNVLIGGRSVDGRDLTSEMSYAILDAYYDMNLPQPILSVKLHKNTPEELYRSFGRFFFTPGCLTPSLFNDDSLFPILSANGAAEEDLENYAVAGCQEPLIMGKDNGNTTNSWLNLAKILELTLNDGASMLTGRQIGEKTGADPADVLPGLREAFYKNVERYVSHMVEAANGASRAIANERVPFLSVFMGGAESGYDMRDTVHQGTPYNGSGCLIHGLSVVADSFVAVDRLLAERPWDAGRLIGALRSNFEQDEELRAYMLAAPKYGNNIPLVDGEAREIATRVSKLVASQKNYLGNPFRPDWSTPTTHLLYGYWTAATPDGRKARDMLNYGVDPFYGEAGQGLGFRVLSSFKLPYELMSGGYASHFGIDPKYFTSPTYEEKGVDFKNRVLRPLFFNDRHKGISPYYLYVNVTTPEMLRKVLANPRKYAPGGVYIMRIHGTFVNFLDLSPAIQQDIINRLDLQSTAV